MLCESVLFIVLSHHLVLCESVLVLCPHPVHGETVLLVMLSNRHVHHETESPFCFPMHEPKLERFTVEVDQ